MGTIAARDCIRVLELVEQVMAAHMLASAQAIVVRERLEGKKIEMGPGAARFLDGILSDFELVTEDRPLEQDLRRYVSYLREQKWDFSEQV